MPAPTPVTLEQFLAQPEDPFYRDEVSRGQLVREPPPSDLHGAVVIELALLLGSYLKEQPIGRLRSGSGFLLQREPLTVRAPDIAFVCAPRLVGEYAATFFDGAPDLAIEVVSPANSASDMQEKIAQYFEAGTSIIWVVYPRTRSVALHHANGEIRLLAGDDLLSAPGVLPGFAVRVSALFV